MLVKENQEKKMVLHLDSDLVASKIKDYAVEAKQFLESKELYEEVILDMENVNFIDSMGITFIISLYKSVTGDKRVFKVANINKEIQQLFKLMKLNELF